MIAIDAVLGRDTVGLWSSSHAQGSSVSISRGQLSVMLRVSVLDLRNLVGSCARSRSLRDCLLHKNQNLSLSDYQIHGRHVEMNSWAYFMKVHRAWFHAILTVSESVWNQLKDAGFWIYGDHFILDLPAI